MNKASVQPRIVLLVPGFSNIGGVPAVAKYLLQVFLEQNWDVQIIELATSRSDSYSQCILNPSSWFRGPQLRLPEPNVDGYSGSHFGEIEPLRYLQTKKLRRTLDQYDLAIVVAGTPAWALAARGIKTPVILHVATTTAWERASRDKQVPWWQRPYRLLMTKFVGRLDRMGSKVADQTWVLNEEMQRWIACQKSESTSVKLIPPAIDTTIFHPLPTGWDPNGPLVSIGRLAETRKGWVRLLKAYAKLVASDSTSPQLVIAGRGKLSQESQFVIESNSLQTRIVIHENPTESEVVALLSSGSAFVTTPFEEGLGIAALEGMACGLPIIATETAGSRQYVEDGINGFLLPQSDELMFLQFNKAVSSVRTDSGALSAGALERVQNHYSRNVLDSTFIQSAEVQILNHPHP